ncbi:Uncharacterised protein [Bordetella pertussis]|nr:Uncharacterised protein [Bordetella pertussis]
MASRAPAASRKPAKLRPARLSCSTACTAWTSSRRRGRGRPA